MCKLQKSSRYSAVSATELGWMVDYWYCTVYPVRFCTLAELGHVSYEEICVKKQHLDLVSVKGQIKFCSSACLKVGSLTQLVRGESP